MKPETLTRFRQLSPAQALAEADRFFDRLLVAMVATAVLLFAYVASGSVATAPTEAHSTAGEYAHPYSWREVDAEDE